eukprot:gene7994-16358_t
MNSSSTSETKGFDDKWAYIKVAGDDIFDWDCCIPDAPLPDSDHYLQSTNDDRFSNIEKHVAAAISSASITLGLAEDPSPGELERLKSLSESLNAALGIRQKSSSKEEQLETQQTINRIEREIEVYEVVQMYRMAERVNVLFLLDATNSMKRHLNSVKLQIREIAHNLKLSHSDISMHISVVAYRDYECSSRFEILPFTSNITEFEEFLDEVKPITSKDSAEDVLGGLNLALQQNWNINNAGTKVLIHICDAPCHGKYYHNIRSDEYPDGDPYGLTSISLLNKLKSLNIDYVFGRINFSTDKMIKMFNKELGSSSGSSSGSGSGGFIQVTDLSNPANLSKVSTERISASITKSTSSLLSHHNHNNNSYFSNNNSNNNRYSNNNKEQSQVHIESKKFSIVSTIPDWNRISEQIATMYTNKSIQDIEQLLRPTSLISSLLGIGIPEPTDGILHDKLRVKMAPQPFAYGETRIAKYAVVNIHSWIPAILKEFNMIGPEIHSVSRYIQHIEVSAIAFFLAQEYNKMKLPRCTKIHYLRCHMLEIIPSRTFSFFGMNPHTRYYCLETPLPTGYEFIKYTNN